MDEERQYCKHCRANIRRIDFLLGPQWMHVNPSSSFPTTMNGGLWRYCHLQSAEPAED